MAPSKEFFNLKPETPEQRDAKAKVTPADIAAVKRRMNRLTVPGITYDEQGIPITVPVSLVKAMLNRKKSGDN